MTGHKNGKHEVDVNDTLTSKYETGILLSKYGYLALTIVLGVKWLTTFTGLIPTNESLGTELEMAWVAWTAGLIAFTLGKQVGKTE